MRWHLELVLQTRKHTAAMDWQVTTLLTLQLKIVVQNECIIIIIDCRLG